MTLFDKGNRNDLLFDDEDEDAAPPSSASPPSSPSPPAPPPSRKAPREQDALWGHREVEEQILRMFSAGRLPHGLIFSGPPGIGKATVAFRLARFLLSLPGALPPPPADEGPGLFGETPLLPPPPSSALPPPALNLSISTNDPIFAKVASGGHPDLLTLARAVDEETGQKKTSVSIEDVRRIAPFLRKTPSVSGGWRVVIVDDSDTMTRNGQNSLLKILEEPPERSALILVTHRIGALIPTIRSRCAVFPFHPLPDSDIRALLEPHRPSPSLFPALLAMASGSPGRALDFAEHAGIVEETLSLLGPPKGEMDWMSIQAFAENALGKKGHDESQRIFEDALTWAAAALARHAALGTEAPPFLPHPPPLAKALQTHETLAAHFRMVRAGNLDKRALVMGAYAAFESP